MRVSRTRCIWRWRPRVFRASELASLLQRRAVFKIGDDINKSVNPPNCVDWTIRQLIIFVEKPCTSDERFSTAHDIKCARQADQQDRKLKRFAACGQQKLTVTQARDFAGAEANDRAKLMVHEAELVGGAYKCLREMIMLALSSKSEEGWSIGSPLFCRDRADFFPWKAPTPPPRSTF